AGVVTLKLTPVYGDIIHYEIGAPATTSSLKVPDPRVFPAGEMEYSFLCVDGKGKHDIGAAVTWKNRITIKSRTFQDGSQKMVELRAAPDAPIHYTTDGSDPKTLGGMYSGPFPVPSGTICVLAIAEKAGIQSEVHRRDITWDK